MNIISKPILVSGPSVSALEVEYSADAAKNGWNAQCFDYINRFEKKASEYLGVEHALAVSSCTGALHLAMLSLGIGAGDEVIMPESTWVATANAVEYVGATPVFADVEEDSWTISPQSLVRLITPKTKAVIVVHLYGHPCNMPEIMRIAKEHHLYVVEDAAQCLGGEQNGAKVGSLGDIACFSFHGSKAIVMGEGGLFTTNNQDFYDKANFYANQGKHPTKRFFNTITGYKYKLSNLQAAFGLAQLERVDEIIEKKRQIFKWYHEKLQGVPDITLNAALYDSKSTYWMPTLVLGESYTADAEQISEELLKRNIETRPFFYPLSTLPMYEGKCAANNPHAYYLHKKAFNMPGGAERTEEEIDYVCAHIRDVLCPSSSFAHEPGGWLAFREQFLSKCGQYPHFTFEHVNDIDQSCALTFASINKANPKELALMKEDLQLNALFVRCKSTAAKDCELLLALGFREIQRVPYSNAPKTGSHEALELIKSPFQQADFYMVTYQK